MTLQSAEIGFFSNPDLGQSRLQARSRSIQSAQAGGEEIYFLFTPVSPEILCSCLDYISCEEFSENF